MRGHTWARCANCGQATYRCANNNCTPPESFVRRRNAALRRRVRAEIAEVKATATGVKAETIARLEEMGALDPSCLGCHEFYMAKDPASVFAPSHKPNPSCESGKHAHCTCDSCFTVLLFCAAAWLTTLSALFA